MEQPVQMRRLRVRLRFQPPGFSPEMCKFLVPVDPELQGRAVSDLRQRIFHLLKALQRQAAVPQPTDNEPEESGFPQRAEDLSLSLDDWAILPSLPLAMLGQDEIVCVTLQPAASSSFSSLSQRAASSTPASPVTPPPPHVLTKRQRKRRRLHQNKSGHSERRSGRTSDSDSEEQEQANLDEDGFAGHSAMELDPNPDADDGADDGGSSNELPLWMEFGRGQRGYSMIARAAAPPPPAPRPAAASKQKPPAAAPEPPPPEQPKEKKRKKSKMTLLENREPLPQEDHQEEIQGARVDAVPASAEPPENRKQASVELERPPVQLYDAHQERILATQAALGSGVLLQNPLCDLSCALQPPVPGTGLVLKVVDLTPEARLFRQARQNLDLLLGKQPVPTTGAPPPPPITVTDPSPPPPAAPPAATDLLPQRTVPRYALPEADMMDLLLD